jgi:hypothetical protein
MPGKESNRRDTLDNFLDILAVRLPALADSLTETYFHTTEAPHQLVQLRSRSNT